MGTVKENKPQITAFRNANVYVFFLQNTNITSRKETVAKK